MAAPAGVRLYRYRWVVLGAFALLNAVVQANWITFAPVTDDAAAFYGVSDLRIGLLSMVFTLGDFVIIKIMTGGAPGDSTHVLSTLAYRYTFLMGKLDWGVGTFVVALPVTLLFIFILIRWVR